MNHVLHQTTGDEQENNPFDANGMHIAMHNVSNGAVYANTTLTNVQHRPALASIQSASAGTTCEMINLGTPDYALTSPDTPMYQHCTSSAQSNSICHVIPSDDQTINPLYENLQLGTIGTLNTSTTPLMHGTLLSPMSSKPTSGLLSNIKLTKKTPKLAVELQNVNSFYGKGKNSYHALRDVTLRVPIGGIYGLLGPSGCGKTSLLRIIVGRKRACSGTIRVFGRSPGESSALIPGPGVGFMPQELSLFPDFTITETLVYFARLYRMPSNRVPERIRFLLHFLDLESLADRLVKCLSGGQQRRVSLAAALVHSPPLIILDEPTVGVDPLLRQSIWEHLVNLTMQTRLTVMITTHYVEEASRAKMIGMMRFGRLLIEAGPNALLRKFHKKSLEETFLHLCLIDDKELSMLDNASDPEYDDDADEPSADPMPAKSNLQLSGAPVLSPLCPISGSGHQTHNANDELLPMIILTDAEQNTNESINLISHKNPENASTTTTTTTHRIMDSGQGSMDEISGKLSNNSATDSSSGVLSSNFTLNHSQRMPFKPEVKHKFAYGHAGNSFELQTKSMCERAFDSSARVNALVHKNLTRLRRNLPVLLFQFLLPSIEVILFSICIGADPFDIPVAVYNQDRTGDFGSMYLQTIDNYTIRQMNYSTLPLALQAVKDGQAWAAIAIKSNFSDALSDRHLMGLSADNFTIDQSNIYIFIDMTNQLIGYKLQRTFLEAFQAFSKQILIETGQNPAVVELPVKIGKPIYGDRQPTFTEFMAPGVVLTIAFLAAVALTALAFVLERKEGLLERSLIAGVTSFEFLISHIITQLLVILVQVSLLLIFTFLVFDVPSRGPFVWVILLTFLQATCGMSYGLLISTLCESETAATMMALGSFYPNLLLSGTVWPTQAMPNMMRSFANFLPQTIPIESMRYIISRGWDLSYPQVYYGFAVTIVWIIIFLVATLLVFKRIN